MNITDHSTVADRWVPTPCRGRCGGRFLLVVFLLLALAGAGRPDELATSYRSGEIEINTFAIYASGDAQETQTRKRTEKATRSVERTRTVQREVLIDDPAIGAFRFVTRDFQETVRVEESYRRTVRETEQVGPFDDHAFGLGIDAKYFVTQNVGVGVEMNWLQGEHDALTFLATGTARFPLPGSGFAPYLVCGFGVQAADTNRLVGTIGAGLMKRFSSSCGVFVEARWRFDGDQENVCELRTGISIAFGRSDETPGQPLEIERTRESSFDSWNQIDPLAKPFRR